MPSSHDMPTKVIDMLVKWPTPRWRSFVMQMAWFYRYPDRYLWPSVLGDRPLSEAEWKDLRKDVLRQRISRSAKQARASKRQKTLARREYMKIYMRQRREKARAI